MLLVLLQTCIHIQSHPHSSTHSFIHIIPSPLISQINICSILFYSHFHCVLFTTSRVHWGLLSVCVWCYANRGKFGTVYKCQEKSTGLKLAAKFVPIPKRDDRRNVEREVEIMNSLQHPLIIQLYDAYEYGKMMCVVLELWVIFWFDIIYSCFMYRIFGISYLYSLCLRWFQSEYTFE